MPSVPSQVSRDLNLNSGDSVELAFTEDILRGALTIDITPGSNPEVNRDFSDLSINREWDGDSVERASDRDAEPRRNQGVSNPMGARAKALDTLKYADRERRRRKGEVIEADKRERIKLDKDMPKKGQAVLRKGNPRRE